MSNDNGNLSEIFRELQEVRELSTNKKAFKQYQKQQKELKKRNSQPETSEQYIVNGRIQKEKMPKKHPFKFTKREKSNTPDLHLSHVILGGITLLIGFTVLFPDVGALNTSYAKETSAIDTSYELNRHRLDIEETLKQNVGNIIIKEQVIEERSSDFETIYTDNAKLPKGEELITQEGVLGKDTLTLVKHYQDDILLEELVLDKEINIEPIDKLIDLGTSEFLADNSVHIGDTMYVKSTSILYSESNSESNPIAEISEYLDVQLIDLIDEQWCKVSFNNLEGFLETSTLTSASATPSITEKNRIAKILLTLNIDLQLNKPSGFTLTDFEKILTNLSKDVNNVFKDNYQVFYNVEQKYNINGIALAAIAIHESNWGTSEIAETKNNLFGYGSYDDTPLESSFEFDTYADGIETVAKSLVKYYINPQGTMIYNGETALAWYYNGPTLEGVNTRYATDENWYTKVYSHVEDLYSIMK